MSWFCGKRVCFESTCGNARDSCTILLATILRSRRLARLRLRVTVEAVLGASGLQILVPGG